MTKRKAKPSRVRGLTLLLALLFLGSAGLRGMELSTAMASDGASLLSARQPEVYMADEDVNRLAAELVAERERLEAWSRALQLRARDLEVARVEISEALAALQEAERALEARMVASSTANDEDLNRLTAVYEAMNPKEAADVFEAMPAEFAAGFLALMQPNSAAAVFAGLSPEKAYSVSVVMAGRNANAAQE